MQYGGNWAAAGQGADCGGLDEGHDYQGKAYVNDQPWDISNLGACPMGSTCPVSNTFTDERFAVPMGCQSVGVNVQQNRERGTITVTAPSSTNGWRGELMIEDQYTGQAIIDFTVTLTCQGTQPTKPVRLSCVHSVGSSQCKMGRIEAFNPRVARPGAPAVGAWGTVW